MFDQVEQHFERCCGRASMTAAATVFAMLGDGIAAAFPSADAAVGPPSPRNAPWSRSASTVRMGLHTGEVERAGDDLRGRAVNRAARIMAVGHGGQILLSDVTATLVRSGPDPAGAGRPRPAPPPRPRGAGAALAGPPPALGRTFPAAPGPRRLRPQPPAPSAPSLVGRDASWTGVAASCGHRRVVTLTGVGGVGKTRLASTPRPSSSGRCPTSGSSALAASPDPDDVASAIAAAIGAAGSRRPAPAVQLARWPPARRCWSSTTASTSSTGARRSSTR